MLFRLRRLLATAGRDLARLFYACRNPRTPRVVKLAAALLAFYVVNPFDLVPELLPVVGVLDDITIAALVIPALLRMIPEEARREADVASDTLLRRLAFWK